MGPKLGGEGEKKRQEERRGEERKEEILHRRNKYQNIYTNIALQVRYQDTIEQNKDDEWSKQENKNKKEKGVKKRYCDRQVGSGDAWDGERK